jgi:Flp pilus assembly protein TadD
MIELKPSLKIRPDLLVMLLLTLANMIVYWQVQHFEFIIFDDPAYVVVNPMVQNGLTLEGLKWAFTTFDYNTANWHPLTWLSLMLDRQFYGFDSGGYHWTNLLFHMVNTLLLFALLHRMTKKMWPSAFVAALFAVHPLHIESVAWVSERKDLLCTFFWFLATWSYLHYVENCRRRWYVFTLLLFALGLMAKPMAVTFPFVILLLDYWPLCRFRGGNPMVNDYPHNPTAAPPGLQRSAACLFLEKGPFLILSLLSSVITFLAQNSSGAVQTLTNVPLTSRMANALVAYCTYIVQMIWPQNLAAIYPLPTAWPPWHVFLAGALIISITATVLFLYKKHPYLLTGWFWYLGTLVPVIGLVQVGQQSMADRYTYIPLIGLFIIMAWGAADILRQRPAWRVFLYPVSLCIIGVLMILSWYQVQHWRSSLALFRHTLAVTRDNYLAHNNMGVTLQNLGDFKGAESHFQEALRIRPRFAEAHANLGIIYGQRKDFDRAVVHLREAIRLLPRYPFAHFNLGQVYLIQKRYGEAADEYILALGIRPDDPETHNYLGVALIAQNNIDGAVREFETALRILPDYTNARINLSRALEMRKAGKAESNDHDGK